MKRTRESDDVLLDKCIQELINKKRSPQDCLELFPEKTASLESKLALINLLNQGKKLRTPGRIKDRTTILQAISMYDQLKPEKKYDFQINKKKGKKTHIFAYKYAFVLVFFLLTLIGSFYSTAIVSAKAIPGDYLYPFKIGLENIELIIIKPDIEQVKLHFEFASRRLREADLLIDIGSYDQAANVISAYNQQIESVYSILEKKAEEPTKNVPEIILLIHNYFTKNDPDINDLLNKGSETQKGQITDSIIVSRMTQERVLKLSFQFPFIFTQDGPGLPDLVLTLSPGIVLDHYWNITITPTLFMLTDTPKLLNPEESFTTITSTKEIPLYNYETLIAPRKNVKDTELPTDLPTPRRTPLPTTRQPSKTAPSNNPISRPQSTPTRTPLLP